MPAKDLMRDIAQAAWECGDPGLQYDTTVNRWNPVSVSGPHQRLESLQRIHVPRRHRLQPRLAET